jgi:tRNA-Thr(GGU) m(6)t(6)A37 methyltransferase TsaA
VTFSFKPIGVIHSPFKTREDIDPLRNVRRSGFTKVEGKLEIFEPYATGLKDIDGFSHLIVIFAFHQSQKAKLLVKPPLETRLRGVFSTRSPHRPNPLGLTIVRLLGRRKNILKVSGLDMLDGTPILDIKPYTPKDIKRRPGLGWLEQRRLKKERK